MVEADRSDPIAVGVLLLALHLQRCSCKGGKAVVSTGAEEGDQKSERTIPDFDRLVPGSGHDSLPVGREGHGGDVAAVRVALLALQLQCACVGGRSKSVWAQEGPFLAVTHQNPRL